MEFVKFIVKHNNLFVSVDVFGDVICRRMKIAIWKEVYYMSEDILVTVVIPVYNVENYINRCIKSIVNQTYSNLEILIVDDGSPDNCPSICDEWALKDSRIRVIHKSNEGLSMARNTGIQEAQGKYIFFLDSDDYVEKDIVKSCVDVAQKNSAEVVIYGNDRINKQGKTTVVSLPYLPNSVITGCEIQKIVIPCLAGPMMVDGKKYYISAAAWAAMYSMDIIRRYDFQFVSEREIISEDIYSNLVLYQHVGCVAIIPKVFYHYCENNALSLTRVYDPNRFERNKVFYTQVLKLCDEFSYFDQIKKNLSASLLGNIIALIKQIVNSKFFKKEKKKLIRTILNNENIKKKIYYYDFNIDKSLFKKCLVWSMKHSLVSSVIMMICLKNLF